MTSWKHLFLTSLMLLFQTFTRTVARMGTLTGMRVEMVELVRISALSSTSTPAIPKSLMALREPLGYLNGSKVWRIRSLIATVQPTYVFVMLRVFFKRERLLGGMVKNMLEERKLL